MLRRAGSGDGRSQRRRERDACWQADRYADDMTFNQNAWYVAAWQENALKNEDKVVVEEV